MVSVLGIPYDANSSFLRGPAQAPAAIRQAFHSDSSNYFTETGIDLKNHSGWKDVGNVSFVKEVSFFDAIRNSVVQATQHGEQLLALGGDHSITFPVVSALAKSYPGLTILHLDAHPDLYHNFEGNPYSHASPFARIFENKLAHRLVQVGIRTMNQHQREQAKRFGVEVIEMKDWNDSIRFDLPGPVYLSLDLDVIDPAFAPGVSHHEPGGFTTRQVIQLLQGLRAQLVGADLVELNPTRDVNGVTAMVAAKLFKEMLGIFLK
ncbi:MAG: agmatinase [Bacteroidota bacterium]